jgi:hypothetical protein
VHNGWLDNYGAVASAVSGSTGAVAATETFVLPQATLGPYVLEDVIVTVPGKGADTNMGRLNGRAWSTGTKIRAAKFDGILGYDILKHFVVTIDYKRSLLHLHAP